MKIVMFIFLLTSFLSVQLMALPKTVFVQLFEWPWKDIAKECENYLGPNGFAAVQVSPPQEHLSTFSSPWWERYQPISYKIASRSGTEAEFIDMVDRCNKSGVDIYVDAVINHMSGFESGTGFTGSVFSHFNYDGLYNYNDFHHCNRNGDDNILNFSDRYELFSCELLNLADLNTASAKVQNTITEYLNRLTYFGVKGFRIDAAKHMDPADLKEIKLGLKGSPYIIQELIVNPAEPISYNEYSSIGDMTVFAFPFLVGQAFKQQKLGALRNINLGLPPSDQAIVFIDNHDLQRINERSSLLSYQENPVAFRLAQVFLLTWPYGYPQVFSGFKISHFDQGPPIDENLFTKPILDKDFNCSTGWLCEHRLPEVANLVHFRNTTDQDFFAKDWWSNGSDQLAFSRGELGFVAINNSGETLIRELQTSLPPGNYCNLTEAINSNDSNCQKTYYIDRNSRIKLQLNAQSALVLLVTKRKVKHAK